MEGLVKEVGSSQSGNVGVYAGAEFIHPFVVEWLDWKSVAFVGLHKRENV